MDHTRQLLSPLATPAINFDNRVVMAPMNRRRAINGIPGPSSLIYYGQRASAGLMITDNTAVTSNGFGYLDTPGIYNAVQQAGWKKVVEEVHARKGKIFVQLVHTGRIGHPLNHEDQAPLVAPSVVRAEGLIRVPGDRHMPMPAPTALSTTGTQAMIDAHINAAVIARQLGFDGVEIHGAHGFLPEQFLHPHTNRRADGYGGSIAKRARFLLEIMEGVAAAIGKERTGIRLSPFAGLNDMPHYIEEASTHEYITDALEKMGILYIHLSGWQMDGASTLTPAYIQSVRKRFHGLLMLAGGYTAASGEAMLQAGLADLIAFGKPFIANPDLVQRFHSNAPLAMADEDTFYQGGDKGYIDYPAMPSSLLPI